jgi:hypothetical protein
VCAFIECLRRCRTVRDWRHCTAMEVGVKLTMLIGRVPDVSVDVFALGHAASKCLCDGIAMRQRVIIVHVDFSK